MANAQGQSGGQLPPPVFDPALVFDTDVGHPYGLASADFLDADGNPGQDGYPEIAVAGAGVDLFDTDIGTVCETSPLTEHYVKIFHNKGADPNFAWDGPNAHLALVEVQQLNIHAADPEMWAMELAFADVTGDDDGPDLVLVGMDPDLNLGFLVVYENLGNGMFNSVPQVWPTTVPLRGLVAEDFDLDGDIDVIASASDLRDDWYCSTNEQDAVVVFKNMTEENFGVFGFNQLPLVNLGTPFNIAPGDIVVADFASLMPGQPLFDLVTPNPHDDAITSITNLGTLNFDPNAINPPPECDPGWFYVAATSGLFGADLHWDVASVFSDINISERVYVDVFQGDGLGSFQAPCSDPPGYQLDTNLLNYQPFAHGIASGHIDNGPYPDLAVAIWRDIRVGTETLPSVVGVLLGKSTGTFQSNSAEEAYHFETGASSSVNVLVVDLDADGFDDIVVANHLTEGDTISDTISVLINALEVTGIGGP